MIHNNNEKFEYFLSSLTTMFAGKHQINKTDMLRAIGMSQSTWDRRNKENDKYSIPQPARVKDIERAGKAYRLYEYDVYDLALFQADKDLYWQEINSKSERKDFK